jgi:hypothetical protein
MNMIELVTKMSVLKAVSVKESAKLGVDSGLSGAKDMFLAWAKDVGVKAKDAQDAWKEASPEKATSTGAGWAAGYYDWLAECSRTEKEARDHIMAEGNSNNVKAHLTHYLNIWALAETVRSGSKTIRSIGAEKVEKAETFDSPETPDAKEPAVKKARAPRGEKRVSARA